MSKWDMNKFLLNLRARKMSWRDIYWKVWGITVVLQVIFVCLPVCVCLRACVCVCFRYQRRLAVVCCVCVCVCVVCVVSLYFLQLCVVRVKWLLWKHCNTLQRTPTRSMILQQCEHHTHKCKMTGVKTLQHTAAHCNTLQHTATYCNRVSIART